MSTTISEMKTITFIARILLNSVTFNNNISITSTIYHISLVYCGNSDGNEWGVTVYYVKWLGAFLACRHDFIFDAVTKSEQGSFVSDNEQGVVTQQYRLLWNILWSCGISPCNPL